MGPSHAGNDVEGCRLIQASRLSLLHDVDERQSNTSVQHHDASDWHLSAVVHHPQRETR